MADEKLVIDITAKDDASKVIDPLTKKVDALEKSDPTIDVDADVKSADSDVDTFAKKLAKLSASDQVVLLALRAGNAQQELTDIATQLATIDADDPSIDLKVAQYEQTSAELDDIKSKITAIGDADPDGAGHLDVATKKLDGIAESSGRAKDAVHGMAGGAIGDFAATASGIGPLGEALSQMTEAAAGGEASIKELATAGLSMGALGAALYVVQGAMKSIADTKAFHTSEVDAYVKSLRAGGDAASDLADRLDAAGKIMATPMATNASNWLGLSDSVRDVTKTVTLAGLSIDQYTQLVTGSATAIGDWAKAQVAAGVDAKTVADAVDVINQAQKDYKTATDAAAVSNQFFASTGQLSAAAAEEIQTALTEMGHVIDATSPARKDMLKALRDMGKATDDLDLAYQGLSDTINHDQALINLRGKIDDVRAAGDAAYAAQAAADKARSAGAKDAAELQTAADVAMRTFQTSVNDTKLSVIDLGNTAKANPVDVQTDLDKITRGDLDSVAADAEQYFRQNPIDAATRLKLISTIVAGVGQPVTITGTSAGLGDTINVTQVLPRGYHGDALADASRSARRSGGLYRRARR